MLCPTFSKLGLRLQSTTEIDMDLHQSEADFSRMALLALGAVIMPVHGSPLSCSPIGRLLTGDILACCWPDTCLAVLKLDRPVGVCEGDGTLGVHPCRALASWLAAVAASACWHPRKRGPQRPLGYASGHATCRGSTRGARRWPSHDTNPLTSVAQWIAHVALCRQVPRSAASSASCS